MKTPATTNSSSLLTNTQPLTDEAQTLFDKLREDYGISDSGGLVVLRSAFEAFDRMRAAQARIAWEGMVFENRHGEFKPHPCVAIERDSRTAMLAALKALHLDLEPIK